jgi:hypothetical protein
MPRSRPNDNFDGEHEPDYTPEYLRSTNSTGIDAFRDTVHYEKFKLANWRTFQEHTGHWPLLSMTFHYGAVALMLVGVGVFVWVSRNREWSTARSLTIGGLGAIIYIAAFLIGESVARKLDWKLFGNRATPDT